MRVMRLDQLMRAGRGTSVRLRLGAAAAVVAAAATGTIIATGVLAGPPPSAQRAGAARAVPPNEAYVAPVTKISAWVPSGAHTQQHHHQLARATPAPVPSVTLPAGVPTKVPTSATPTPALDVAANPLYGPILVNPAGMTVYRSAWGCGCDPGYAPLLTRQGQSLTLPVMLNGQIGTVTRANGTLQVTFDGWPLYLYSGDKTLGDTNGADRHWLVTPVS